jgi:hypothetical protein
MFAVSPLQNNKVFNMSLIWVYQILALYHVSWVVITWQEVETKKIPDAMGSLTQLNDNMCAVYVTQH